MPGERVMVVDDTPGVANLVAVHLQADGFRPVTARSGKEALDQLAQGRPDLFIVDIMMPEMDGFELTRRLRADQRTAAIPIIVLTARDAIEDKIRGFEAGADDYVVKPFEAPELLARVRALLARRRTPAVEESIAKRGTVMAVFGLRGGAGRSTLAANLSVSLAATLNHEVAACDLALESGHLALMLDARPVHTIDQLVTRYGANFEQDVLLAHLAETRHKVRLLAAPLSPASATLVTDEGTRAVLEHLREAFPFVVLDLAPGFSDVNLASLEIADTVLMVTTPEMAGIRAAAAGLEVLDSLSYPPEDLLLVINQVFSARPLGDADISSALDRDVAVTIPHDGRAFVEAINRGIPIVVAAPRAPASRAIAGFAHELAQQRREESVPAVATAAH